MGEIGTRPCIGQISLARARRFDVAEPWTAMRGLRLESIRPCRSYLLLRLLRHRLGIARHRGASLDAHLTRSS